MSRIMKISIYVCYFTILFNFSLGNSLITLMWALFGLVSKDVVELHMQHSFIETMGEFMLLSYQLLSIVVLLNMLIAMMSNSFQTIQVTCSFFFYLSIFSLPQSLTTLMWGLFGLVSKDVIELWMNHDFGQFIGECMLLAYHLLSIVVLLNMLIAMMSNSFQTIQVKKCFSFMTLLFFFSKFIQKRLLAYFY